VFGAKNTWKDREDGFARYIAEWPNREGTRSSASFSVNLYGEEDAFELAVYRRCKGLRELGLPSAYYERGSDDKRR
jgi:AP2 domain